MISLSLVSDGGIGWVDASGPESHLVLSTRVRLARHLGGRPFAVRSAESDREDSLVTLLVRVAPSEARKPDAAALSGPAIEGVGDGNVVTNQEEVDALLANLGF